MIGPMLLPVPASFLASKDLGAVLRIPVVSQRAVDYIRERRERVTGLLPPEEGGWTP